MLRCCALISALVVFGGFFSGCMKSSPSGPPTTSSTAPDASKPEDAGAQSAAATSTPVKPTVAFWDDYPDVPKVEIMTEVDGIKIPRMKLGSETLSLKGPIPADVGNEHAKQKPSEPVTGGSLTIRFNAEPKVLNPLTEQSAYMTYIMQYVNDLLYSQNSETFEFEPRMAKSSIVEDAIKLSADYPGRERRVVVTDGPPLPSQNLDYVVPPPVGDKPAEAPKIALKTSDKDGKSVGHVWVGVYPIEKIPGASTTGYHYWSDARGNLEVSGFPAGKYVIKTGDEVFGQSAAHEGGSLIVKPVSPDNALKEPLTLAAGEWQDVQAKTYWTFNLRNDVKWSDGTSFTTKDIEFGYALINNETVDADSPRTYYGDLVECRALDPLTVRMKFRQQYFKVHEILYGFSFYCPPFHFFEAIFKAEGRQLVLDQLKPEDEAAKKQISARGQEFGKFFNTDERYNSKPLGTGPYVVDKWERKDRVELVRNPNFWEPSKAGHLDRIIVKFIPDQVTALTALRSGEIDFLYSMEPEQYFDSWPTLEKETQENYVRADWFVPVFQYVGWNQLAPQLKDRRVRMALTMLFDRQDFLDKKMHGAGIVVSGTQYVFGPGYDSDVAPLAYDPETARELLSDAGWIDTDNDGILDRNGVKFSITLRMPIGRAIYTQICEVMQKNFKSVGIDLQIQTLEWASFLDKVRAKECDAVMLRWAMPTESDPFQIWHSSEGAREKRGSNSISFQNPVADELIEMLRVTLDENKRRRIHQSFHRLLDSEQPYSFLWTPKEFGAYHKRFRGVKWYRLRPGFDLTEWYIPKDEQTQK